MATAYHHLSDYDPTTVPSAQGMRFGIVVADWNDRFTYSMADAAIALRGAAKSQDRGQAAQLIADMKALAEQL